MAKNEQLQSAVSAAGYNKTTFAEELGVCPQTVRRWINQGRTPRPATAEKAAELLDVPPTNLWPGRYVGEP